MLCDDTFVAANPANQPADDNHSFLMAMPCVANTRVAKMKCNQKPEVSVRLVRHSCALHRHDAGSGKDWEFLSLPHARRRCVPSTVETEPRKRCDDGSPMPKCVCNWRRSDARRSQNTGHHPPKRRDADHRPPGPYFIVCTPRGGWTNGTTRNGDSRREAGLSWRTSRFQR